MTHAQHLNPVEYVIFAFKGVRATARYLGKDPAAISKWRKLGTVPVRAQIPILDKAKELGLDITPADLIYGRGLKASA
jgi:hypothetical protein